MRNYKKYDIPNRLPRTIDDLFDKQINYCNKSDCDCSKLPSNCSMCLFSNTNIDVFAEWYMLKNKPLKTK